MWTSNLIWKSFFLAAHGLVVSKKVSMNTKIHLNHLDLTLKLRRSEALNVILVALSLVFCAGCFHLISDYDIHTYRALTGLKGEMKVAFEEFGENGASGNNDLETLRSFLVKISQALEYEKGKNLNDDTIAQFTILDETVKEVFERFEANGNQLSAGYAKAKWMVLRSAFDIAIKTEGSKINKK